MKPSWNDAPEWAQWLAQDMSGHWYWHEVEPYPYSGEWCFDYSLGRIPMCQRACDKSLQPLNGDWQSTLEKRPQTDTKG